VSERLPPEPFLEPEPSLPVPGPIPEPGPEATPEPDEGATQAEREALRDLQERLERERAEFQVKEQALVDRERSLSMKEREIEAQERAVTERLVALEKDASRRDVLRFLGTVPGMTEAQADVIATGFPDLESLQAADVKALTQCKGVTEALARAIRFELVPGEVEEEQRAIELREEAQAFLEEGDYGAALECYDRLLREGPEDTALWFDRAELLVLLDRPEEALQCYTRVLDVDRRNRQAWFERANLLFGLGRLADAVDALREALRIDPAKSADVILKAEQLRRDRHPNEAAILFQAILNVHPDEPRAVLGLGDTLLDLGDIDAAEGLFARALGRDPQNPPILFRKGELLERKGRWGAAIQYYNRAIALRWDFPDPWMAKGSILLAHDRPKEALECFDKVLSFDPERVEAWAAKARAHAAVGESGPAGDDALAHAARLDPAHPAVKEARDAIEALSPRPSDVPEAPSAEAEPSSLADAFAEIEEVLREPEPAGLPPEVPADLQSFVESIEPEKEDAHVLLQLAELALEAGDAQMALLRYDQAAERDPRSPDAWTGKGVALQQLERYREALAAYDHALALKPDHELARRWRSTCLRRIEQEDVA
jgi:tetratricopeptide (TPR) repeat protein